MPPAGAGEAGVRSSYERVIAALEQSTGLVLTRRPMQAMARCPVHEDGTPSLSVRWTHGPRGGLVLMHCHGCGARAGDLVEVLGLSMSDLFDEPLPAREAAAGQRVSRSPQQRLAGRRRGRVGRLPALLLPQPAEDAPDAVQHEWTTAATYPYRDASGRLVQEVVREQCTTCRPAHKGFRQLFVAEGGTRRKTKPADFRPVLYRHQQVLAAVAAGTPVWLLEGEKDVETAEAHGLVATTNTQGGRAFPAELVEVLRGADVRIVLDRDDAGWDRGVGLHAQLTAVGADVRLLLPVPTDAQSDFTDHVEGGHSVADLIAVHVLEVAAWAALSAVRRKHQSVVQALTQTELQLAAAHAAGRQLDVVGEHRQRAVRWAVETEIRFEALRDLVDDVHRHVVRTGTEWAGQASNRSVELLGQARHAALTAHEQAGVDVPPSLQDPRPSATAPVEQSPEHNEVPDAGWDPAGNDEARVGAVITAPTFRIVNGQIVQVEPAKGRRERTAGQEPDGEDTLKLVLGLDVRIVQMEYLSPQEQDDEEQLPLLNRPDRDPACVDTQPSAPQLVALVLGYTHPLTGEWCLRRVAADDYPDCRWLESLPGPPAYDSRPAGVAKVRDAIKSVSGPIAQVTRFRSTGWRLIEGQWHFLHARASIGPDGEHSDRALMSGPLARYDLPSPTQEALVLREAFSQHSGALLTQLPGRVAAPLLGHVYRSALGPNPWVLALIGSPGSYKTSIASLAMQHWGELWDRTKPCSSMSGNGDTLNAQRIKLNASKDVLYWADDVAPTKDWVAAQKMIEEFARLVHNGEQRSRAARDGQSELAGTPPRSSALITSEVMPRPGSGAQRMLVVPLHKREIDLAQLKALSRWESRSARALLMASLLQWLAGDLTARRARLLQRAEAFAEQLVLDGVEERPAAAAGQTWAGWVAMTEFLSEVGALSAAEAEQVLVLAEQGIREAADAAADPDLPVRTGARARELITHALRTGAAYVQDVRTGGEPSWPLAGRLGWRRAAKFTDTDGTVHFQSEARGVPFGYLLADSDTPDGPQLLISSTALEQVLKQSASTLADAPQLDRATAMQALHEEGVLIGERVTGRPDRLTVQRTLHCEDGRRARMVALRLFALLGEDDRGEGGAADPGSPSAPAGGEGADADARAVQTLRLGPAGGLFDAPDPAVVDASQQPGVGCQSPLAGLTSPTDQESSMGEPLADAEGLFVTGVLIDSQPCLLCGAGCIMSYLDLPIHVMCWRNSTGQSRDQALQQHRRQSEPVFAAPALAPPATSSPVTAPEVAASEIAVRAASSSARLRRPAPTGAFRAPAAVLHTDGVWLADGTRVPLPEPLRHVGQIAELVPQLQLGTQVTAWRAEPGQIWVTGPALRMLGVDTGAIPADPAKRVEAVKDLTRGRELVDQALADGWQLGGDGSCLAAWTRVWRGEQRGVWVALVPAMNTDPGEVPALDGEPCPATLARRLALFAGALQAPWAVTAASTGFDLMISLRAKDRERLFTPHPPVPPARLNTLEVELDWSRVPDDQEQAMTYLHGYDRGGSHAAGIAGLELGIGAAEHHPAGRAFDAKLPGYWRLQVGPSGDWRMPHPLHARGPVPEQPVWVSTPTLALATELGHHPQVLEAYVWPEHVRILDPWYERLRDARTALDLDDPDSQRARDLLKVVYTRTIGMMGSHEYMSHRMGYGPERRHHIIAKARANILRRINKIGQDSGRWPLAVTADTVLYPSDDPDPVTAWPGEAKSFGRGFGQFKPEASGLLKQQLPYLNGHDYRGKQHLEPVAGSSARNDG